jgi:signal transduction histidine kinase
MRLSQAAPLVLVPGLLIALAVMWFGISQIVQPLQQLEARSSDLAWGNFDSINQPLRGIDEIRQLQKTLQFMAGRIQTTQSGMRHYIAAMTRGQEEERVRLARELHDGMIQSLIALGHREQILRRYLRDDPGGQEVLNEVRSMTTGAVDDLRRIIRAMRPIYLEELGLTPALEMLAKDLKADSEIEVHFSHEGLDRRLESEQELALFRVAQEALNNVKQHSHADSGWLAIHFDTGTVMITVRDNGDGFQAPERITELSEAGHFGLMGMAERAQLVGARLQIESLPGRGTTVTLSFDIPADS